VLLLLLLLVYKMTAALPAFLLPRLPLTLLVLLTRTLLLPLFLLL
jgi:hypothetical protein